MNFAVHFILPMLVITMIEINMTVSRYLDLDPGSQRKLMNSWCVSFETECIWPSEIGSRAPATSGFTT